MERLKIRISAREREEWRQKNRLIDKETAFMLSESPEEKRARIDRLKKDYKAFFEYYFPMYAKCACAPFHIRLANKVMKTPILRAVVEAFRGSAKSTHVTIGIPFWLMVTGQMKTMLLVGENQEKGAILLGSLQAQLESNRRILNDFGEMVRAGSWEEGRFITRDGVAFFSLGLGQSPRGIRNDENRPDYIVCDDLDTKERCKNPKRVREAVEWILDDLMGCFDVGAERFVLCNNRIHKNSILSGLLEAFVGAKSLFHLKVNAVTAKGEPTWKAKYTKAYWDEKQRETTYRSFQREYMNNPIEEGTVFRHEWMQYGTVLPWHRYEQVVAYCDPSFKGTTKNDYKAIMVLGKTKEGGFHLLDCFVRQTSVSEMVDWFYELHAEAEKRKATVQYWMEANFMQDLLLDEFDAVGRKRGHILPIRGDKRKKPDKFGRIEAMQPLFERGLVTFDKRLADNADLRRMLEQFLSFEKGSRTADDAPDAFEGAVWMLQRQSRPGRNLRMGTIHRSKSRRY